MVKLNKDELLNIDGGGVSVGACCIVGLALVFIAGVLDGYVRPLKCNKK